MLVVSEAVAIQRIGTRDRIFHLLAAGRGIYIGLNNIEAIRRLLVSSAAASGAPEPEDAAHDVLLKALARGGGLHPHRAYWFVAGRNQARMQQKHLRRHPSARLDDVRSVSGREPPMANPSLSANPVEEQADLTDCRRLGLTEQEFVWLLLYADALRGSRTGADRVRAHRLRVRVRQALKRSAE